VQGCQRIQCAPRRDIGLVAIWLEQTGRHASKPYTAALRPSTQRIAVGAILRLL
jgi:hypothetical protein